MTQILIAIDAWTPLERLLPVALLMASHQHAALVGIFSLESRLRQGAALPFIHEVGALSAASYPVTAKSIDRRIQSIAESVRQRLAAAAERNKVPWEFRTCDGSLLRIANETDADVVFPGWNRKFSSMSARAGRRISKSSSGTFIVVDDGSPSFANTISAARKLAINIRLPQLIIFKLNSDRECPAEKSEVAARQSVPSGSIKEIVVPVASMEQLMRHLRQSEPFLMLIGRDQRLLENSQLLRVLALINCPVALLRRT